MATFTRRNKLVALENYHRSQTKKLAKTAEPEPPPPPVQRHQRQPVFARPQPVYGLTDMEILRRSNSRCYLCGKPLLTTTMNVEHIIPLVLGGTNESHNLAASCQPCNGRKGSKIVAFSTVTRKPYFTRLI